MLKNILSIAIMFGALIISGTAHAEDYVLTLKDHQFSPSTLTIPKDKRVKIRVENKDATPAEFESYDLKREKIISGNGKAFIFIGPLPAGVYEFFDEFHPDTAQGTITVN